MLRSVITDSDFIKCQKTFIFHISRHASRAVLIDDDGFVALMYMARIHCYKLPGGGIKQGESEEDALVREVLEETGYGCRIISKLGTVEEHKNKRDFMQKSTAFLARSTGQIQPPTLTSSEKKLGFELHWLPLEDAVKKMRKLLQMSSNYSRNFMIARDLAILEYALANINKIL